MPTDHAILAPSAASRWLKCAPSARLEEQMPNQDTSYTREGTLAHAIGEILLHYYLDNGARSVLDVEEIKSLPWNEISDLVEVAQGCQDEGLDFIEMLETVHEGYVRIVYEKYLAAKAQDPEAILLIEQKLKLEEYVPESFGSTDAAIIWNNTCDVNDLKYGKGLKVNAEGNNQMMLYALGALCGPCELYDITEIQMTILQPRLNHVSSATMSAQELLEWAKNVLRPAALQAFKGEGSLVTGNHCQFCRAAPRCKALMAKAQLESGEANSPELLELDQLGDALKAAEVLKNWAKKLEDYCLKIALEGAEIPGYKIVEGRSLRCIKDTEEALKRLIAAGFDDADVCKPKELKTITDLEKLLRKQAFNSILGDLVIKPQGKPTLAPESDKRPVFKNVNDDFKDIEL